MTDAFAADKLKDVIASHQSRLEHSSGLFLGRVYDTGLDIYARRLRVVGFSGKARVLDAGCGFGQWTLSLAGMNGQVTSLDISQDRVDFVRDAAAALNLHNVRVEQGSIETLPFEAGEFDAVYCYGTLFLTRWRQSLAELGRVLKPGGTIYLNANGIGWYKHLWVNKPYEAEDYDPRERAAKAFLNAWRYGRNQSVEPGMDILVEPEELRFELEQLGFTDIRTAGEGRLRLGPDATLEVPSFFRAEYLGDTGVYEIVATKRGS